MYTSIVHGKKDKPKSRNMGKRYLKNTVDYIADVSSSKSKTHGNNSPTTTVRFNSKLDYGTPT